MKTPQEKPKKRGPKKRPASQFKGYRLQIRLTPAERRALERAAIGDVSTWARGVLLALAAKKSRTKEPADA